MSRKLLGVVLLIGACLLGMSHAHSHGDHGEGGGSCNMTAVSACLHPYLGSGVLVPFTNVSNANNVREAVTANTTHLTEVCEAVKGLADCLKVEERKCFNDSAEANFTAMANFTVPTAASQHDLWRWMCRENDFCQSKVTTCYALHSAATTTLKSSPDYDDPAVCQSLKPLLDCILRDIPFHCRMSPGMKESLGLQDAMDYCEQRKCDAMKQCQTDYMGSEHDESLNDTTCFLFRDYTKCAGGAVANCSGLSGLQGGLDPSNVSDLVEEGCTAMGQDAIKAIYTCNNFTKCVEEAWEKRNPVLLPNFCSTFQGVVDCAIKSVGPCSGVNADKAQEFQSNATAMVLRAQAMGCGRARVRTDDCDALQTCAINFAGAFIQDSAYDSVCLAISTFQSCADAAVRGCNLAGPPPKRDVKEPRLGKLSNITRKMCDAMRNQTIHGCLEFQQCTESVASMIPRQNNWEIISGQNWCDVSIGMVECVRSFSRTCEVAHALMEKVENVYEVLLDEGCKNKFKYVIHRPTPTVTPEQTSEQTPEQTTKPTGGAQSLVGVSLMGTLLMACLSLL